MNEKIDDAKISGEFRVEHFRDGKLLSDTGWIKNTIVNGSFAIFSARAGGISATQFTYLALGETATAPAATQSALTLEISTSGLARAAAAVTQVTTTQPNDTLQLAYTWTASGSKTVEEVGVFNASSGGVMAARGLTTTKSLVTNDQLSVTYKIKFA